MNSNENNFSQKGIIKKETGISEKQGIYFYEASDFTKKIHHYVLWGAEYHCNSQYKVIRKHLDCFILFWVKYGSLTFKYRNRHFTANENEMVLLDCKYENVYYVENTTVFKWFHFSGGLSQKLCDELYEKCGSLFIRERTCKAQHNFNSIFELLTCDINIMNENKISTLIYELLCSFFYIQNNQENILSNEIKKAVWYINQYFNKSLDLKQLSHLTNLSVYHFCRVFKRETGFSPHKYIMNIRIIRAKEKLVETSLSIEEVAFFCGFSSRSHFIRSFIKYANLTPGQFRKMRL
ncbi:helix-turn-helix domain-containing protein [Pectinatus haikarae]|uniref:AraC-like DNA-binding protein n=1 Tax=Pectinatus haikarae TaxID=349096 RepID=A0ABT9Y8J3_9FIRM|nr:AraC family transcriptional regulator [Pectinatus haikarae]MDQ0204158.1 AraC-like DNA-binding protein [Pectinatus haikarae]